MASSSVPSTEYDSEQRSVSPAGAEVSRILAPNSLASEALYQHCDISKFTFTDTTELQDLAELIGQERALKAIEFGADIDREGFNLFLLGPAGNREILHCKEFS